MAVPGVESLPYADSDGFAAAEEGYGPVVMVNAETDKAQLEKLSQCVSAQQRLIYLNPGFRGGCLRTGLLAPDCPCIVHILPGMSFEGNHPTG